MKRIQIQDFTEPELEAFRKLCNFSDRELAYFNLRAKDKSNIEIAYELNTSTATISNIARKVKSKMIRVL